MVAARGEVEHTVLMPAITAFFAAALSVCVFLLVKSTKSVELLEYEQMDLQKAVIDARGERDDALKEAERHRAGTVAAEARATNAEKALSESIAKAEKEIERTEKNLKTVCRATGLPLKREYTDADLKEFGRKARLRAQLGPEIAYIFRTAAQRGMV